MTNPEILVSDAGFTVRTENILRKSGIKTLGELIQYSSRTLLKWRGISKGILMDIRNVLLRYDLCLLDDAVDEDVKRVLLKDIPECLGKIRLEMDEIKSELTFLSFKVLQICEDALVAKKRMKHETRTT